MPSIVCRQSIVHFLSHFQLRRPISVINEHRMAGEADIKWCSPCRSEICSDSWSWRLCNCQARQWRYAIGNEETLNMTVDLFRLHALQAIKCNRRVRPHRKSYFHGKSCLFIHFSRPLEYLFILFSMFKYCPAADDSIVLLFACRVRVHWIGSGATISIGTSLTLQLHRRRRPAAPRAPNK